MILTRLQKPERKAEKRLAATLRTIHNARLKRVKREVKLLADSPRAIKTACPEVGRVQIAEGNLPTIRKTCPNQAKKAARLPADNSPTRLINRPAAGKEADAVAISPMTAISRLERGAMMMG